ncbi:uncharacterized protein EAF02_012183 [Botrytis sinoallii]|uniref:uncharacterized protein n=1 Tax=Botrytis sinoallii TaxID=1463999 RepID=UPI0018FF842E|nr:uncharacterized protein EAF02_012183 [Botrytis sinoallii]KAF7852596.1 hypothetical protein EAF02_012183 [Botrytis sinoallii]
MEYSCQGVLPLLGTYCTDHIGRKTGLCHPARLFQQAVTTQFYMSSLKLPVSCLEEYSFRSRKSHRSSCVPIALAPLRIIEDPEPFRVSSLTVSKSMYTVPTARFGKQLEQLVQSLSSFPNIFIEENGIDEEFVDAGLGWYSQSSWLHETKVFGRESGAYEIGHLPSTPIVSAQHSTSRPYLFYILSNEYTGLDSRIISTRLGGLGKFGASILKAVREGHNIEEETLALQTKRYRSLYPLHRLTYNLISGTESSIKAKLLLQEALEGLPRGDGGRRRYATSR